MREIPGVWGPGTADDYLKGFVQLAPGYDMDSFKNDLKDQKDPVYGFHVWGPCPRCGHLTSGLVPLRYLSDALLGAEPAARLEPGHASVVLESAGQAEEEQAAEEQAAAGEARRDVTAKAAAVTCRCPFAHANPGGSAGCGAEWLVAFEYPLPADQEEIKLRPVPAETAARVWAAADGVAASVAAEGQTAMTQAGKWTTALGSLVALITVAGVLGGHDTIQALPVGGKVGLALVTLLALGANALMIYFGNFASAGYPVLREAPSQADLLQADIQPLREAQASIDNLGAAKSLAVVTVLVTLVAVGLFLFMPPRSAGQVKVKYTDTSGVVHQTGCGTLVPDPDPSGIPTSFTPDGGTKITFSKKDSVEIDAC